uniref:Rho-GAP domain-containing protein n=1 Tax=Globodera rostochiensis TaxID=31243 RepID=A0A914H5J5_GLORO
MIEMTNIPSGLPPLAAVLSSHPTFFPTQQHIISKKKFAVPSSTSILSSDNECIIAMTVPRDFVLQFPFRICEDHTPRHQQLQSQTARRNSARRHTTPDMAASAAYGMVLCGSDEMEQRYRGRIEKVKFGVPVNEAFCPDIPATLLVLLLKVYKEGPLKKDIWRAPGNQAQVRKLSHIMQHGRLVNISNISVYTAASVIKRFLAKLPGGIFGVDNERQLFELAEQQNNMADDQQIIGLFCRIVTALTVPSQHLLVLLFGTFRVITDSAQSFGTRMTPDAIGISVAPSLFHTCIHDGQRAKLEDIMRFKLASQVITKIIQAFGLLRLFPFECYEFYARITGKTLRRDENCWHISFHLPSNSKSASSSSSVVAVTASDCATAASSSIVNTNSSNNVIRVASKRSAASRRSLEAVAAAAAATTSETAGYMCEGTTSTAPPEEEEEEPEQHKRPTYDLRTASVEVSSMKKATTMELFKPSPVTVHRRKSVSASSSSSPRCCTSSSCTVFRPSTVAISAGDQWKGCARDGGVVRSRPPPPPPCAALQRLIEGYCLAANLNVAEQLRGHKRETATGTLSQPAIRFERRASSRRESSFELEQQSPSTSKQRDGEEYEEEDVHGTAPPSAEEFCCEDEDVYGESLPELGRHVPPPSQHYRRREQSRSLEESKIEWKYRASASGGAGAARRRREEGLSTSMGEVVVHSEEEEEEGPDSFLHSSGFLLESTRSLTYLEWVHERQTRRMKTRSEWFLSPPSSSASPCSAAVVPSMRNSAGGNGGNKKSGGCCSRSAELLLTRSGTAAEHRSHGQKQQQQQQCHHHLQLPSKEEEAMVSSSGEEEVCMSSEAGCCSRSGCAGPSTDTSMKCSPQRPGSSVLSCCTSGSMGGGDAQMKSQTTTEASSVDGDDHDRDHDHDDDDDGDDDAFLSGGQCSSSPTKVLRQPFQLLQERQYSTSTTEGSGPSAQVTPSATTGADVLLYGSGTKNGGGGGAGGRQRFFGSGEQEGGLQALPELVETSSPQARRYSAPFVTAATMQPQAQQPQQQSIEPSTAVSASAAAIMSSARPVIAASMSSGSSSGGGSSSGTSSTQTVVAAAAVVGGGSAITGEGAVAVVQQQQQQQQQGSRGVSSGGVVRRRSWRVHYTRPKKNKSFEYETSTGSAYEEVAPSSHSTPLCQSQPGSLIFTRRRRSSNGGGGGGTGGDLDMAAVAVPSSAASSIVVASAAVAATTSTRTAAGTVLVRRRSSNNGGSGGGTNAKAKIPVQSRRSTQI